MNKFYLSASCIAFAFVGGCATQPDQFDYTAFREEAPRSILVLPALNNTLNVNAPDFFLSTLSVPLSQRGYYAFPAHMVKRTLEENGLSDTGLVYQAETVRLGELFGCDAALYVQIQRWESQYVLLATQTSVEFDYALRSCETGDLLWTNSAQLTYSPQSSSTGNPMADLLAQAVTAAVEKAAPNYMPLARQANNLAMGTPGVGLPAGPYLPEIYGQDTEEFPSSSSQ